MHRRRHRGPSNECDLVLQMNSAIGLSPSGSHLPGPLSNRLELEVKSWAASVRCFPIRIATAVAVPVLWIR